MIRHPEACGLSRYRLLERRSHMSYTVESIPDLSGITSMVTGGQQRSRSRNRDRSGDQGFACRAGVEEPRRGPRGG